MKSALDLVFAARETVTALRMFARTSEMLLVANLGTEDALSVVYASGYHSVEIAVLLGPPVEGIVSATFNFGSGGNADAIIVADTRPGSGKWSFRFKIEEGCEQSEGARQAATIATAMGLEKDEIKVVETNDEAQVLVGVAAARMIEIEAEERGAAVG